MALPYTSPPVSQKWNTGNWASYVREIFCEFVHSAYKNMLFDGDVGTWIWIFGIVEQSSNKLIKSINGMRKH